MLQVPFADPVFLELGPLKLHWYGLMYVCAFIGFLLLGKYRARQQAWHQINASQVDDLLFWGALGVIIGGRLGEVLFYHPEYYFSQPVRIFAVWQGGMSFHGGLLGVLLAVWLWGKRRSLTFLQVCDFIAPLVPLGLMFGRLGNFINGELWGRVTSAELPWAMVFTRADYLPRHPSPLYQAGAEGLLLFICLWVFSRKQRALGTVSAWFLIGYALLRLVAEFFREPDSGIFGFSYVFSMGQWLSVPMLLLGMFLLFWPMSKPQQ